MDEPVVMTIDELLERLEHVQEMESQKRLEELRAERCLLLQELQIFGGAYKDAGDLGRKTAETVSLLEAVAAAARQTRAAAEDRWLAYWGIGRGGERRGGSESRGEKLGGKLRGEPGTRPRRGPGAGLASPAEMRQLS